MRVRRRGGLTRGTDGRWRRPLPSDELVNELRPGGGWSLAKWLVVWRIGIGDIVLFVLLLAAFALVWGHIGHEQTVQCRRGNARSKVLRDVVVSVQIAQHVAASAEGPGFVRSAAERRAEMLTDRALALARRKLAPERC